MGIDMKPQTILQRVYNEAMYPYRWVLNLESYQKINESFNGKMGKLHSHLKRRKVLELQKLLSVLGLPVEEHWQKHELISRIEDTFRNLIRLKRPIVFIKGKGSNIEAHDMKIRSTTQNDLDEFYEEQRKLIEQREERAKNPETLAEFYVYILNNGRDSLNKKQDAKFKELQAIESAFQEVIKKQ